MFLRLSWFVMAVLVGVHVYMAAAYATPDPCRAVGAIASEELSAGFGASLNLGGDDAVLSLVEGRLRQDGLMTCYGALGRIWYEGGVSETIAREYGITLGS